MTYLLAIGLPVIYLLCGYRMAYELGRRRITDDELTLFFAILLWPIALGYVAHAAGDTQAELDKKERAELDRLRETALRELERRP